MSSETLKQLRIDAVLQAGETVGGHYRVDRLLAEGGMAAVWAGENLRTGKRVALKVIRRSFAVHSIAAEMFRRESIAASKVNHPNVVSVFDVIDHSGMTLIVMELLHGETLAEYLEKKKPLSLSETVMLLLPAMRGVAAAHAQGVIHRDLKPGNIFLCQDSDGSLLTTKVLDFGISTIGGRMHTESDQIDLARFGTPAYMSPEDIAGSAPVDIRADVYGFGILLFEALTGRLPFEGQPSLDLLDHILNQPAPKLRSLRPELPIEIDQIIDSALAKNPNDRFSDVEHLIHAIEERVLPPLAVPRAMMPMAESSLSFSMATGASTRLLIAEPPRVIKKTPLGARLEWSLRRIGASVRSSKLWDWRIGVAAIVVIAGALGSWRGMARSSRAQSATPVPVATVPPAPAPVAAPAAALAPAPVALPATLPAAELPSVGTASVTPVGSGAVGDQPASSVHLRPSVETAPAANVANYGPFEAEEKPTSRPGRASRVRKPAGAAPRAGRLSVSDF